MEMERVMLVTGKAIIIGGGAILASLLLAGLFLLMCEAWILASNRFRDICKAESLIHEYRRNREKFLEWLAKGDEK
mgnify:CR=1 FL=1